jgi:hypothetical protein
VHDLETFNITVIGASFPVQRVDLADFDFGGLQPTVQMRLQQIVQAGAGEYVLQILPNRFQVAVFAAPATDARLEVLRNIASTFVAEYTVKNGVTAIGHNFVGSFVSVLGSAADFMRHIAWQRDFAAAIGVTLDPGLSLTTTYNVTDEESLTLRVEPWLRDSARVYYDINFNWGQADKPLQMPVRDIIERIGGSLKYADELIDRLASIGASRTESGAR